MEESQLATKLLENSLQKYLVVAIPKLKPYKAEIYDEIELINLLNVAKGTDMEIPITL